jgi:hypothetical protein
MTRVRPPGGQSGKGWATPPPWGPRRGSRGSFGGILRRLLPPSSLDSSGSGSSWWLAHQTSQIPPRTGILRTTMRKKIGQNPVKRESLGSSLAGFDGEPAAPGHQRFGFRLL